MTVRLRLFAQAKDAAGRAADEFEAATLGALLDAARARYGETFGGVLGTARVWVNGDEPAAGGETVLADGDEVAVLPPVSGGAGTDARRISTRSSNCFASLPHGVAHREGEVT
jgi:sulfur-carrier protein